MCVVHFDCCEKKTKWVQQCSVESLGYPERVRGVGTSVVATWTFQADCMYKQDTKTVVF